MSCETVAVALRNGGSLDRTLCLRSGSHECVVHELTVLWISGVAPGVLLSKTEDSLQGTSEDGVSSVEDGVVQGKQAFSSTISVLFYYLVLLLLTELIGRRVSIPTNLSGSRLYYKINTTFFTQFF